jgi:hypothetical protein
MALEKGMHKERYFETHRRTTKRKKCSNDFEKTYQKWGGWIKRIGKIGLSVPGIEGTMITWTGSQV